MFRQLTFSVLCLGMLSLIGCDNYVPNTTLYEAIVQQNEKDVKAHLRLGEKVNITESIGGYSPLSSAVRTGNTKIVKHLLRAGAFVNGVQYENRTPLAIAAENGDIEMVRLLLDAGADPNGESFSSVERPLEFAAKSGSLPVFRLLIQRGAHLHRSNGQTPSLEVACSYGQLDIINELIDLGIDIKGERSYGSCLDLAYENGQLETVKVLTSIGVKIYRSPQELYEQTMWKDHTDAALALIAIGLDDKEKALHLAVEKSNIPVAEALIKAGAKPTPHMLDTAIGYRHDVEMVKTLIAAGVDVNARGGLYGETTPLMNACSVGSVEMVKALIAAGANVNYVSAYGFTPWNQTSNQEIKEILVAAGAKQR